jgi:hypothetical protein
MEKTADPFNGSPIEGTEENKEKMNYFSSPS